MITVKEVLGLVNWTKVKLYIDEDNYITSYIGVSKKQGLPQQFDDYLNKEVTAIQIGESESIDDEECLEVFLC